MKTCDLCEKHCEELTTGRIAIKKNALGVIERGFEGGSIEKCGVRQDTLRRVEKILDNLPIAVDCEDLIDKPE